MSNQVKNAPVERIETRNVNIKNGPRAGSTGTIYSLIIGNQSFQWGWNQPTVMPGQLVSFSFTTDKYGAKIDTNTVMIGGDGGASEVPPVPGNTGGGGGRKNFSSKGGGRQFPVPLMHGDRSIIRQNALSHAARIVSAEIGRGTEYPDVVAATIGMAAEFEKYSAGDIERRAAEAAAESSAPAVTPAPAPAPAPAPSPAPAPQPAPQAAAADTPPWQV